MKNTIIILLIISAFGFACKVKKGTETPAVVENQTNNKTIGKVSHEFRKTGCETVIIVSNTAGESPLVLIPLAKLPSNLDVDGLVISFDYKPSKVKQPEGCSKGIPAVVSNVIKK